MTDHLEKDVVGLVIQYLKEKGLGETAKILESEGNYYFDMHYFKELFLDGDWDKLVPYLKRFLGKESMSSHSVLFFEILKHKYFYYLDNGDKIMASWVLKEEVKHFFDINEVELDKANSKLLLTYNELAALLTFENFRTHSSILWLESGRSTRAHVFNSVLKYLDEKVPSIKLKTKIPDQPAGGRLRTIVNQGLNWTSSSQAEFDVITQTMKN